MHACTGSTEYVMGIGVSGGKENVFVRLVQHTS